MSRCFPYPLPAYLRQGLFESIKLEREKVLPKTEQKLHKKREKKEKKKERKGKDRTQGLTKKFKKLDDGQIRYKDDQLENSDLTEEHEPPVCYISDGSQNSNKRKRETLSSSECKVNGKVLKIRFSLKKPREPEASLSEEPVCSSIGRAYSDQEQCYPWSNKANTITQVHEHKLLHDDERTKQVPSSAGTSADDNEMQKAASQYKTLTEDWMLPLLQVKQDDDDDNGDEWLVMKKQPGKPAAKRSKLDNDVTCASSTSYPSAHFLPEAEIHALPYTVPF